MKKLERDCENSPILDFEIIFKGKHRKVTFYILGFIGKT